MGDDGAPILSLRGITKSFDGTAVLSDVSFAVRRGEIFSLLGPSGCGKSTTLRIIAGLEQPEAGHIELDGRVLVSTATGQFVPPQRRNLGMVFQSYAIWPHLSVFDTVAYPLAARKIAKAEIATRAKAAIRQVGMEGYEDRLASTLSGGQQQRVALARSLVYEPALLLLDEPFSNLDMKLREQMRIDLKLLQRRLGVTVILVTHDQLEALSLSDRIALINRGEIEQLGTPFELYENPRTAFARDFIGTSMQLPGRIVRIESGHVQIALADGTLLQGRWRDGPPAAPGDDITLSIRPESMSVLASGAEASENTIAAKIEALLFVGDKYECVLQISGRAVRSFLPRRPGGPIYREGQGIRLALPVEGITAWPR